LDPYLEHCRNIFPFSANLHTGNAKVRIRELSIFPDFKKRLAAKQKDAKRFYGEIGNTQDISKRSTLVAHFEIAVGGSA
jgi:hypothetical protein